ncbi:MAG: hypothetical protein JOY93_03660 [Acidobacteriales bacterium]|nr:hypothetical protein [Terriglobales bacterium]
MKVNNLLILVLILICAIPSLAEDKKNDKRKNEAERGMLEKMEAVPCGAKERGITGVGSVFASAGVHHVNSDEKLCPQYLFRTDKMEYHIRPTEGKHPDILPVGKEGTYHIKNDVMYLRVDDGDRKTRTYHVVSMQPLNSENPDTPKSDDRDRDKDRDADRDRDRDRNKDRDTDKDRDREADSNRSDRDADRSRDNPPPPSDSAPDSDRDRDRGDHDAPPPPPQ